MRFNRLYTELQNDTDRLIRLALRDQLDNTLFSRTEQRDGYVLLAKSILAKQFLQKDAGKVRLAVEQSLDSRNKLLTGVRFQQETTGPRQKGFGQNLLVFVHRKDQHLGTQTKCFDAATDFQPVHQGHRIINDDDVRPRFQRQSNRMLDV